LRNNACATGRQNRQAKRTGRRYRMDGGKPSSTSLRPLLGALPMLAHPETTSKKHRAIE
jgi:hypothetical protein